MAEIHSKKIKENKLDTVLAEDISFTGELSFARDLMIKGKFQGVIKAAGDLFIAETAHVEAQIMVKSVHIEGKVQGNIQAASHVELTGNAELIGDITAPKIVMEKGCRFEGLSKMIPLKDNAHEA